MCILGGTFMSRREDMLRREYHQLKKQQRTKEIQYRVFGTFIFVAVIITIFSINSFMLKVNASSESETVKYKYYTSIRVDSGETLWSIAKKHSGEEFENLEVFIEEVKSINQLKNNKIYAGQELVIPYYSAEYK